MTQPLVSQYLLPYQMRWFSDTSPFLVSTKSRRVGISWTESLKAIACGVSPTNPRNTFYMSYNFVAAKSWLENDVGFWLERFGMLADYDPDFTFTASKDSDPIQVARVKLATGKSIYAVPSKASTLRGLQGRITLDEANFIENLPDVLRAAFASTIWGNGQISVISTEGSLESPFHQLVESIQNGTKLGSLHITTIYDACTDGLYKTICKKSGKQWSQEAEDIWIQELIKEYSPFAESELLCIPSTGGNRVIAPDLVAKAQQSDIPIYRRDYTNIPNPQQVQEDLQLLFNNDIKPYIDTYNVGKFTEAQYVGCDIGRVNDISSLVVLAKDNVSGKLLTQLMVELKGCPFDQQRNLINWVVSALPELEAGAIDAHGLGANIAESIHTLHPKIQAVKASASFHDANFIKLLRLFESGEIVIPRDSMIASDLGCIQYINNAPRIPPDLRLLGRHADSASSLELAVSTIAYEKSVFKKECQPGYRWSHTFKKCIKVNKG